jgi:hypothetical protein
MKTKHFIIAALFLVGCGSTDTASNELIDAAVENVTVDGPTVPVADVVADQVPDSIIRATGNAEEVPEPIVHTPAPDVPRDVVGVPLSTPAIEDNPVLPEVDDAIEPLAVIAQPDHSAWNSILKANVSSSGKVNYSAMKSSLADLEKYIKQLEGFGDRGDWSRNEKLAYWVNLYNAATVRLILSNYPVSSITDLNGGKPWDLKVVTIAGKKYTLNEIENDVIRPKFKDARIHFAVNCAAKSCPPLLNEAFTSERLNSQLNKQTKAFVNSSSSNEISEKKIVVSKIFEWYAADFTGSGSLIDYLNKYSTVQIKASASVNYKEYDWALNQ